MNFFKTTNVAKIPCGEPNPWGTLKKGKNPLLEKILDDIFPGIFLEDFNYDNLPFWSELSEEQKEKATKYGFNQIGWDNDYNSTLTSVLGEDYIFSNCPKLGNISIDKNGMNIEYDLPINDTDWIAVVKYKKNLDGGGWDNIKTIFNLTGEISKNYKVNSIPSNGFKRFITKIINSMFIEGGRLDKAIREDIEKRSELKDTEDKERKGFEDLYNEFSMKLFQNLLDSLDPDNNLITTKLEFSLAEREMEKIANSKVPYSNPIKLWSYVGGKQQPTTLGNGRVVLNKDNIHSDNKKIKKNYPLKSGKYVVYYMKDNSFVPLDYKTFTVPKKIPSAKKLKNININENPLAKVAKKIVKKKNKKSRRKEVKDTKAKIPYYLDFSWNDINKEYRIVLEDVGYNRSMWDEGEGDDEIPDWDSISSVFREELEKIGFNKAGWNGNYDEEDPDTFTIIEEVDLINNF